MAFHILFHGKYLIGVIKKLPTMSGREAAAAFGRFAAGAAAAAVLYVGVTVYKNRTDETPPTLDVDKNTVIDNLPQFSETVPYSKNDSSISAATDEPPTNAAANDDSARITEAAQTIAQNDVTEAITQPQADNPPSLEDYLSNLFCSGCHKHCPLISPRCGRGAEQAEIAKEEYMQIYGEG